MNKNIEKWLDQQARDMGFNGFDEYQRILIGWYPRDYRWWLLHLVNIMGWFTIINIIDWYL